jgi:hypothetical protein
LKTDAQTIERNLVLHLQLLLQHFLDLAATGKTVSEQNKSSFEHLQVWVNLIVPVQTSNQNASCTIVKLLPNTYVIFFFRISF